MRGPGSNPRPLRLLPPLLLLTSGVRVEAAASTRSCFSNPRDPAYLSNPGSLALEPTAQRIRRLTGPRRQSLRRLGLEPVILPHLARARRGARASTTAPRPRTDATCRRQTLPFPAPFTHSAAVTSTPPPFPPPLLLLPPLPPSDSCLPPPACTAPKSQTYEIRRALARRLAARSTAVRTPPARVGAIRTHPRTRGCPLKAARVGATWRPRAPSATPGPIRGPGEERGGGRRAAGERGSLMRARACGGGSRGALAQHRARPLAPLASRGALALAWHRVQCIGRWSARVSCDTRARLQHS